MSHLYFCTARFPGAGRLPGFCGWPVDLHAVSYTHLSAVAATCAVFIAILASYVISRFHFRFKNVLLLFFLVTQMIPMFIMLAPLYQLLAKAKMLNDLRSLAMLYTNRCV